MADNYWDHIEKAYYQVSIYDGPEVLAQDIRRYPEYIVNLLAAHWFLSEISNGGIMQFFYNPTGVLAPEAESAFIKIGLPYVSDQLRESMKYFGEVYPRDSEQRQQMLMNIAKVDNEDDLFGSSLFDEIENAIYRIGGDDLAQIYACMDSYAKKNLG